jgi:hypothetical protein
MASSEGCSLPSDVCTVCRAAPWLASTPWSAASGVPQLAQTFSLLEQTISQVAQRIPTPAGVFARKGQRAAHVIAQVRKAGYAFAEQCGVSQQQVSNSTLRSLQLEGAGQLPGLEDETSVNELGEIGQPSQKAIGLCANA